MTAAADVTTIILAGDRGPDDPVATAAGVARKALAPVAGIPMLAWVLGALREGGLTGRVLIVANRCYELKDNAAVRAAVEARGGTVTFLEGAATPVSSVLSVLEKYDGLYPVFLTTADNALLAGKTVANFLDEALGAYGDVAAGLVTRRTVEAAFPEPGRTFIPLKGDAYTGCNMFVLKSPLALNALRFWLGVERDRKKALRLVAAFGLGTLLLALLRRLDIKMAMRRVSKAVGAETQAVIVDDALAAMDVDRPKHLKLAEDVLGGGQ